MDEPTFPEIPLSRGVKLNVDWKTLTSSLSDVLAQGFLTAFGITDGISGAIASLINAVGSIKVDDDPSEKAWRLFWLSFAWSIDELRSTSGLDAHKLRNVVHEAIEAAKKKVDAGELSVPLTFMARPVTLPLYTIVRDEFVERRAEFRVSNVESPSDLSARFDSAFSRAVFEIWVRKPETFQSLVSLIGGPALNANLMELQWSSYRQRLIHEFEVRPMFGQEETKISLSQAYIPLRCQWHEPAKTEDETFSRPIQHTEMLDDELLKWLDDDTGDQSEIRLIGGGPGSGKSTTVKSLARTAADRPAIRPLFIPLQHIDLDGSLRDGINSYFTSRTRGSFTLAPLAREAVEDGPRLLLIFDGLDEIARPGEGADEVANLFITKLDQLQSALQGDSSRSPKIVVTGRLPSFQAAKRFKGALGRCAVEVCGYAPLEKSGPKRLPIHQLDQRGDWWRRYAPLVGLDIEVPQALKDPRLADVTNEPLLCYLLVLSGFAIDDWEDAAENRNRIYERLIEEVWRRGWGDSGKTSDRQGPGKHLSSASFNALMETIALAAWLGGDTRVATDESFHSALKTTQADLAWQEFKSDGGEDVANLAMNFYLKSADSSQRGFEFTHKSFGDYLASRAILHIAKDVGNLVPRYISAALQEWLNATGTGTLTLEILTYMRDEVRLNIARNSKALPETIKICSAFEILATTTIQEGLPAHTTPQQNWRIAARTQKNSEVMLWAILHSCVVSIQPKGSKKLIKVGFENNPMLFKSFLARVIVGDDERPAVGKCLSYLSADGSNLFGLELSETDFSHSSLKRVSFDGCHLMGASLNFCELQAAQFQRTNLDRCSFVGAIFGDTDFTDARTSGSKLLQRTDGTVIVSRRTMLDWPSDQSIDEARLRARPHTRKDTTKWTVRAARADEIYSRLIGQTRKELLVNEGDADNMTLDVEELD